MVRINRLFTILALVALILGACQPIVVAPSSEGATTQSAQTDTALVTKVAGAFEAAFSDGQVDALDEVLAPAVVIHILQRPDLAGSDAYKEYVADVRNAFPDAALKFEELKMAGDVSFARYTLTGTHGGPSLAFGPPTGKVVTISGSAIAHYEEGKIVEMWEYGDSLGEMLQLGYSLAPPADFMPPVIRALTQVDDIIMYYEIHGNGEPLLLIHGGTTSGAESWTPQIPLLARSFQVIVPDGRGHGRTTDSAQPISYALMAEDYIKLLDKLGIAKTHVVGWSDGAIVGLYLVQQHPERVLRYVGMEPNLTVDGLVPGFLEFAKTMSPETYPADWAQQFYLNIAPEPAHFPEFLKKMAEMWQTQPTFTKGDFANNQIPILLLSGEKSDVVQPAHLQEWAAAIPNATLKSIPDVGHDYPAVRLDEFVADVTGFMGETTTMPTSTLDAVLVTEVEAMIEQTMEENALPGFAIGVVKDGKVAYLKGFGVTDVESQAPVTPNSLFELGSISKQFTAAAIMQLVEQGKIGLDDPLIKHLPSFQIKDERYKEITIRQMLSHMSGMTALEIDSLLDYALGLTPEYDTASYERMVQNLSDMELLSNPGEGPFSYSDIAFNVLGAVVAVVSGENFEDYVRDHIFLPLEMSDSTFELRAVNPGLLVRPHMKSTEGKVIKPDVFPYMRSNAPSSHPYISAADMTHWMLANLNHGALNGVQILQPETHQEMWTVQVPETGFAETLPAWASYGVGWFMGNLNGEPVVGHAGVDLGYIAYELLFPEQNIGVIVMANRLDSADEAFAMVPALESIAVKVAGTAR
jgi:CubicO group peptidase (beta-lactamase class C family)/predicted ester cyclase/esterase/lipase